MIERRHFLKGLTATGLLLGVMPKSAISLAIPQRKLLTDFDWDWVYYPKLDFWGYHVYNGSESVHCHITYDDNKIGYFIQREIPHKGFYFAGSFEIKIRTRQLHTRHLKKWVEKFCQRNSGLFNENLDLVFEKYKNFEKINFYKIKDK